MEAHTCLRIPTCLCCSRFISAAFPNFRNAFKNNEAKMLKKIKITKLKLEGL